MFEPEELIVVDEPAWKIDATNTPVSIIDYSPDGGLVAFSNTPGKITIASSYDGQIKSTLEQTYTLYPVTGCRFHPCEESLLLSTCRDGYIFLHDIVKGEVTAMSRHLGSNLSAMNIDSFGENFAIACADGSIRIYDLENLQRTKALVKMTSRSPTAPSVNIYSLAFHPEDSNVLLAAGWNDRVLFWDVRTGNSERSIAGPHIRGPAMDIHNDKIITGSTRDKKQIEVWDYGTGKKIKDVNIQYPSNYSGPPMLVNAVKIARNGLDIAAGGSGYNAVEMFDCARGHYFGKSTQMNGAVTSVAVSPFGSGFVAGTENGDIICQMVRLKPA